MYLTSILAVYLTSKLTVYLTSISHQYIDGISHQYTDSIHNSISTVCSSLPRLDVQIEFQQANKNPLSVFVNVKESYTLFVLQQMVCVDMWREGGWGGGGREEKEEKDEQIGVCQHVVNSSDWLLMTL